MSADRSAARTHRVLISAVTALMVAAPLTSCGEAPESPPLPTPTATVVPSPTATLSPTPPEATTTPSTPAMGWTWQLHALPGGPARGAASIGGRWVALAGLQAWTSADTAAWDAASVDGTPQEAEGQITLGPVAHLEDRSFAVGMWYGPDDAVHPVVWASTEGTSWTQVTPRAPWGYVASDVASDGSRLAVAGSYFDFGDGRVWTSPDGATWTEHTSDAGPATLNAIHGDADGFVAVGFRVEAGGARVPAVWYSPDGATWTDAAVPTAQGPLTLLDVARLPGGRYVALGVQATESDTGKIMTWYADDPLVWNAAAELPEGLVPGHLLAVGDGMLAVTGARNGPAIRFSRDGVSWTEETSLPVPDVVTRVSAVATDGMNVILLGGTLEGDSNFAWLGRPASR